MGESKQIYGTGDLVAIGVKPSAAAVRTAYSRIRRGELPISAMPRLMLIPGNRSIQVARDSLTNWMALFSGVAIPSPQHREPASGAGRRGRPTTIEEDEARCQGITVPELRRLEFMAKEAGK